MKRASASAFFLQVSTVLCLPMGEVIKQCYVWLLKWGAEHMMY